MGLPPHRSQPCPSWSRAVHLYQNGEPCACTCNVDSPPSRILMFEARKKRGVHAIEITSDWLFFSRIEIAQKQYCNIPTSEIRCDTSSRVNTDLQLATLWFGCAQDALRRWTLKLPFQWFNSSRFFSVPTKSRRDFAKVVNSRISAYGSAYRSAYGSASRIHVAGLSTTSHVSILHFVGPSQAKPNKKSTDHEQERSITQNQTITECVHSDLAAVSWECSV